MRGMRWRHVTVLALCLAAVWPAAAVAAEADEVVEELRVAREERAKEGIPEGWSWRVALGGTVAFTHNRKVVGSLDGTAFQVGLVVDSHALLRRGPHDWRNEFKLGEAFSKLPNIDSFLKTGDQLELLSTYFYHAPAVPWLGPFGRVALRSPIFPGWDVRDAAVSLDETPGDPTDPPQGTAAAQEDIDLTGWFEPLTLKQSVGVFAAPLEREEVTLRILLGVGGQEVLTHGGRVLTDDAATADVLELTPLVDFYQVGAELEVDVRGALNTVVGWSLVANLFQPIYSSEKRDKEGFELLDVVIDAKISVKLASWLSLDYVLSVKRLPLILDEWQVQNNVLLTAGFDIAG